jgi:HSP20 family protein
MSVTRWDPVRDMTTLREAMNQLLEQSLVPFDAPTRPDGGPRPIALDLADRDGAFVVSAALPGFKPEEIEVATTGEVLTIRAQSRREDERTAANYVLRERRVGAVMRTLALPSPVDGAGARASYEDGVLTVTLPKATADQPQRIAVRAGAGADGMAAGSAAEPPAAAAGA